MPTIAAILPNYNDAHNIPVALACVRSQTVPFDEVIIIDDASTDDSVTVIEKLIADWPTARLVRNEKNMGVVATLNRGFDLSSCDYVQMISANDTYFPDIVETGQRVLAVHPNVAMISGNAALWDAVSGKPGQDMIVRLPQREAFYSPAEYTALNCTAPVSMNGGANIINSQVYRAIGGQDVKLKWYADWFLYFLIGVREGVFYVPKPLVTCRLEGEKSFSSGRFIWANQEPILRHMLHLLRDVHPVEGQAFRRAAIFPLYNFCVLRLMLEPQHRWFMTPLFVWRCLGHQAAFWLKHYLPRPLLMRLRRFVRL